MKKVETYSPGSRVSISSGTHPVTGIVTAISVFAGGSVTYRVSWWDGRTRYEDWFSASEVTRASGSRNTTIGFTAEDKQCR